MGFATLYPSYELRAAFYQQGIKKPVHAIFARQALTADTADVAVTRIQRHGLRIGGAGEEGGDLCVVLGGQQRAGGLQHAATGARPEERRGGREWVSTCSIWWAPDQ